MYYNNINKMSNQWIEYGETRSPFVRLGLDKGLYNEDKKTQLYTDTKNYLTQRNKFLQDAVPRVNGSWMTSMKELENIPYMERKLLSDNIATRTWEEYKKIADKLFPNADLAYGQASSLNIAKDVADSNLAISIDGQKKKRGRPRKAEVIDEKLNVDIKPEKPKKPRKPRKSEKPEKPKKPRKGKK